MLARFTPSRRGGSIVRTAVVSLVLFTVANLSQAGDFSLQLRYQRETSEGSGRYHRLERAEEWAGEKTAFIVCDVWDLHHCLNAVRRLEEFAPRLNATLHEARSRGATIIHAPSSCMDFYADHPARKRAVAAPRASNLPDEITEWCHSIPAEEKGTYPIDQSDGGEDDDPEEHAAWAKKLKEMGRNPASPWKRQLASIDIDKDQDFISDRGDEVWNVLESRGIENVVLAGVHTNMCVLGRPFGLRQMARNGKHVVLMRDLTDTMYNPQRWPYVSHFTGTDLIVSHIERHVCPTITSDQLLGGKPFRSAGDVRPHLAVVIAEDEYETHRSLPKFVSEQLGKHFRVTLVFGNDEVRNDIPGIEVLNDADVALFSIRRRTLPPDQLAVVREFVESGKPVVGIRTASHAFSLRRKPAPEGFADWPEFDAEVFGGSYSNHHGNELKSNIAVIQAARAHPILAGVADSFPQGGSLYMTSPLADGATPLMLGTVEGKPSEPVAWTFTRKDGGRSFYSSLGHPADFENSQFVTLLTNGIRWASGIEE